MSENKKTCPEFKNEMKYPKVKKKKKFKRDCHNCTFFAACADRYHSNAVDCKRFRFCSMCKST